MSARTSGKGAGKNSASKTVRTRRPHAATTDAALVPPRRPKRAVWGVLVYLAGDTPWGQDALRDDLQEILKTGSSAALTIVVQHDGPEGASRYVVPARAGRTAAPVQSLGTIDSGRPPALLDFVRWGLTVCPCERVALVLGSPSSFIAPGGVIEGDVKYLTLAYDQGSGNFLSVSELADVLREALDGSDRQRIDLLAIDACHVQFLELTHELEDVVRLLIAPQTVIPEAGWDYRRVLSRWKTLAASTPPIGAPDVARALLDEIAVCYGNDDAIWSVSALDLQRLDDVANAFDTLCIGSMQVLGEGLIWRAWELLLRYMTKALQAPVYDCGSFFMVWAEALEAMADEAGQSWLLSTAADARGPSLDPFFESTARHLETSLTATDAELPADAAGRAARARLSQVVAVLRAKDRQKVARRLARTLEAGQGSRVDLLHRDDSEDARDRARAVARTCEQAVRTAIAKAERLMPDVTRFDYERTTDASRMATHLARQADQARLSLLGDPGGDVAGMVLAVRGTDAGGAWPRWSGVSIYQPSDLDELMNDSYQRFAFHTRVHWAAWLGASDLVSAHPRALWRLVSSLLATGSAGTRRDVLRRLTGSDSVIWGLRRLFKVMAPAPTMTLSLERRDTAGNAAHETAAERYLLRLESTTRGAIVTEQDSRVQPDVLTRALNELNTLLQQDVVTSRSLADLRAIGGLLGEDLFQALGRTLDEERRLIREESPDAVPHLQLQIPRELMRYPWEMLHHHGEWLGELYAMGRQVFMETGLARRVPTRRQGRVRPLIIGDPIFDAGLGHRQLPGARDEAEQVAGWFQRAAGEVGSIIDFDRARDTRIHTRITAAEVRGLLRDGGYDIVHYAGHGVFRADDPETSAWLLSDGELWSLEIRNTLAAQTAPPWLVYANACEAGMDGVRPDRRYQGNVYGLATAFINQGVAAYIAPLWPIDDLLAQHIALEFYQQLLCERVTLGEAVRRAKASARALADGERRRQGHDFVQTGLGWASLVLYGDPTEELFQALAGGSRQPWQPRDAAVPVAFPRNLRPSARPARLPGARTDAALTGLAGGAVPAALHAPDHIVSAWVQGPNWTTPSGSQRGERSAADGEVTLELIEDSGIRRWRVRRPGTGTRGGDGGFDGLPGSLVAAMLRDDRVRELLPATRGVIRVVGRWVLTGLKDGALGLVREYDREQVPVEGLLLAGGDTSSALTPARPDEANPKSATPVSDRALVIIHGTFSKTAMPVDGLGPHFMGWARQHYGTVLGFDHWTLSKTPEENAAQLSQELRALEPRLLDGRRLDIIAHSRGGLVARAFCELLPHAAAVRNLIFIGTPNCGTDLASPGNWGSFADLLVNMTGLGGAELFGRLSGLLAQLTVGGFVHDVPGLLAQSPEAASQTGSFLNRLQNPAIDRRGVRYSVICSEFEPTALVPNLKTLAKAAAEAQLDAGLDALFASANDLVVNTAHAWAIGCSKDELQTVPAFLDGRVLLFAPPGTSWAPAGLTAQHALGIHHCNLFSQPLVQSAIKGWLNQG